MRLMSKMHNWWRRRAVGPPGMVQTEEETRADRTIARTLADMRVIQKELEIYKLDVRQAKKAAAGGQTKR